MSSSHSHRSVTQSVVTGTTLALLAFAGTAWAQGAPRSFVASPDVYKVIAQDQTYLVIEATWAPGQRDKPHSHPHSARYALTYCSLRGTLPDGTKSEGSIDAGQAAVRGSVESVSAENIGRSACKMIFFEPK
jgi:hypothetical protein